MITIKRILIGLLVFVVAGCNALPGANPAAKTEPTAVSAAPEPTAQADFIRGDWQGTALTEKALRERMAKAGWNGLVDFVSEDVENYGPVSRLIVGPDALSKAEAVRSEFSGVLWYVYGVVGSGKECGWKTHQSDLNLLRIEIYSTGNFLPEETSCRQAPG